MEKSKVIYSGDIFKNLIRRYGMDRMQRDSRYRREVEHIMEERRREVKEQKQ